MESNQIVSFVLGPCVVALGLKLYDHRKIVMDNLPAIGSAVVVGSVVSIASVILLGKVCGLSQRRTHFEPDNGQYVRMPSFSQRAHRA